MNPEFSVLQVGKFYAPYTGGIETHLETLARSLQRFAQVRVVVAANGRKESKEVRDGVPVRRLPTYATFKSAPICPGLVGELRRSTADIVHLHLPNPSAVLAWLAARPSGRLLVTYHSDTVRQRLLGAAFEPLVQRMLRRAAAILVTSPDYLATSPALIAHRDRCHIVPYGIDVESFTCADPDEVTSIRARYGTPLLIAVGRLVYYKGFEYLIEAMQQVNARLLLIGDGPLAGSLRAHAVGCGVADKVSFLGELQNQAVIPYYHASEIFVLPSIARSEAFGIVQIEAMASGTPVINTHLDSGVPFVSPDGVTGLTVPARDPAALAEAINRLLKNEQQRKAFGAAGAQRAQREFSLERMVERTLEIYLQVLRADSRSVAVSA